MKIIIKKHLKIYQLPNGKVPFIKWLESLKESSVRYRIKERLDRLALGNYGDYKRLTGGINELRLKFGAGYRVYFGEEKDNVVILLCGGDKSTQSKDINLAKKYWQDYMQSESDG